MTGLTGLTGLRVRLRLGIGLRLRSRLRLWLRIRLWFGLRCSVDYRGDVATADSEPSSAERAAAAEGEEKYDCCKEFAEGIFVSFHTLLTIMRQTLFYKYIICNFAIMLKIGQYNQLKVNRLTDFGAYLDAGNGVEILIPARYLAEPPSEGDELDVFVYTDSEDRLIATTDKPLIQVGQFAFLQVVDINRRVGAFLDWGIPQKHLLCPFNEQRVRMTPNGIYCVYAYLDDVTKRVVASSKIEKFLGNVYPEYHAHQAVQALIYKRTDIGYLAIVNNLHAGMIYVDELITHPEIGQTVTAYVKKVRDDGKLDLTLKDTNGRRAHSVADKILERMFANGGVTGLTDKSSPEEIAAAFGCSKKDFKKAVGYLYKEKKIKIMPGELRLRK